MSITALRIDLLVHESFFSLSLCRTLLYHFSFEHVHNMSGRRHSSLTPLPPPLFLPRRYSIFRPAGLETDDDLGIVLPTDAVEHQPPSSPNARPSMRPSETGSTICRNNTDTTLVGAESPPHLADQGDANGMS